MSPLNLLPPRIGKAVISLIVSHFIGGREVIAEIGEALSHKVETTWLEWILLQTGADPSTLSTGSDFALMALASLFVALVTLVTSLLHHPMALAAVWYSLHHMRKGQREFREELKRLRREAEERAKTEKAKDDVEE